MVSSTHYILEGKEVVPVDLHTWATWFERANRRVAETTLTPSRLWGLLFGELIVITSFVGLEMDMFSERRKNSQPLLFETMVFRNSDAEEGYTRRYCTWDDAYAGHQEVVLEVKRKKGWS